MVLGYQVERISMALSKARFKLEAIDRNYFFVIEKNTRCVALVVDGMGKLGAFKGRTSRDLYVEKLFDVLGSIEICLIRMF